ncbi:hypothetical protein QZH41_003917 [Actinostola sp. cb2023]|nr:hypothetical protein QZH41_003917 [Actinostola sp. cb2023]
MPRVKVGDYTKKMEMSLADLEAKKRLRRRQRRLTRRREVKDLNKKFNAKKIQLQRLDDKVAGSDASKNIPESIDVHDVPVPCTTQVDSDGNEQSEVSLVKEANRSCEEPPLPTCDGTEKTPLSNEAKGNQFCNDQQIAGSDASKNIPESIDVHDVPVPCTTQVDTDGNEQTDDQHKGKPAAKKTRTEKDESDDSSEPFSLTKHKKALYQLAKSIKKRKPIICDTEEENNTESDKEDNLNDDKAEQYSEEEIQVLREEDWESNEEELENEENVNDENDVAIYEEECEENLGPHGPTSKPTNIFQTLVRGWSQHLQTPDGTEKTPAMIRQMCQQVVTIAKAVDPEAKDLVIFLDKDLVYKRFFKVQLNLRAQNNSEGLSSKTLSVYSTSLERFLTYATRSMRDSMSERRRESLEDLRDVQSNWRQAWGKNIAKERAELEWESHKNLPTINEIIQLKTSKHAQDVRQMILRSSSYNLTIEDAVAVRNFIIFLINTENANRAGPIAEMTFTNFDDGRTVDNKWSVHIVNQNHQDTRRDYS